MNRYFCCLILIALGVTGCDTTATQDSFSGVRSMNERTQYQLANEPSTLGGGCQGWSRVMMRQAEGAWEGSARCWKREGDQVLLGDPAGNEQRYPASEWAE